MGKLKLRREKVRKKKENQYGIPRDAKNKGMGGGGKEEEKAGGSVNF